MKKIYFVKKLAFIMVLFSATHADASYDFSLKTLDNSTTVSLSQFKGNVVVVDFWASWCGPCKEAFKAYNELLGKHSKLRVIGINVDKDLEAAKRFVSEVSPRFPVVVDKKIDEHTKKTYRDYEVHTMPTAFIFDPQGDLKKTIVGFRPGDESQIEKVIEEASK